jgi:ATP-dependent helicase/nuclease subunit A
MTVHGAKGLEASVVFMVDTTSSPADTQRLRLINVPRGNGGRVVVWAGRKADDPGVVAAARTAMLEDTEDEYRRLLYVAMTRAADRLIVAGCMPGNMNNVRKLCWYDLIGKGLAGSGLQEQTIETPDGPVKRYSRPEDGAAATGAAAQTAGARRELPDWLRTPVSPQTSNDHFLRPSDAGSAAPKLKSGESIEQRTKALQRGTLVHRLLQSLPDLAADRRRDAAEKFLARNAAAWSEAERAELAEKVLALISDQRFAPVFAEGSRAEVAIVGRLDLPDRPQALVSGQIDRLVVTENEVLIVDFKTNHAPPASAAEAPPAYVRQLALYRAVLRKLYPQHAVRAALLWTETTDLMDISAPALDAALASRGSGEARA